jgi:hypothetical protein
MSEDWDQKVKRYSAKLLFQHRSDLGDGKSDIMRRCEERLIVLSARDAKSALRKAKAHGGKSEFSGNEEMGNPGFRFEFVGVLDLLEIGIECEPDEVWYDISTRKLPMERRDKLIPPEEKLNAVLLENEVRRTKKTQAKNSIKRNEKCKK